MRAPAVLALTVAALPSLAAFSAPSAVFGRHYPHGAAAVDYLYGPDGNWKDQTGLSYIWNYYAQCETPEKPADLLELLQIASTSKHTSPDAHCLLLGDLNNDGGIADDEPSGYAFHEHAGRGIGGEPAAAPFLQFWFDDNWLARYLATAYDRPQPSGLHDHGYTLRWRALGGDTEGAVSYASPAHIDQLALNGLRKLNGGDLNGALTDWYAIKAMTGWSYDWQDQRHEYPQVHETYHLGLWGILSERLLSAGLDAWSRNDIVQHAASIRSSLLSLQQQDASGNRLGWMTGIDDSSTLINTETVSIAVLALGTAATWVLEPGFAPLSTGGGNYFLRPHHVLSAVVGLSDAGHVVYGPYWNLEPGTYQVEFSLRTPARSSRQKLATVDVYDGTSILAIDTLTEAMMPGHNQWRRHRVTVDVTNPTNAIEFRVYWHGTANLDVGPIRVLKLEDKGSSEADSRAAPQLRQPASESAPVSLRELFLYWLRYYRPVSAPK